MKFIVENSYEDLSRRTANDIIQRVASVKNPVVCPASGDSPRGLYKEIVARVNEGKLDISRWIFVGLDEWVGMDENDEGSCRYHLNQQLFHPLRIPDERICFFNGRAADLSQECERVEKFIQEYYGIDVAILGLGMNGHVGMNEPGTPQTIRSHVADLHATTKQVGQKYFKSQQELTRGLTLGIANLMEAKHLMLLVNGEKKAGIVQRVFEEEISEELPTSLLRRHPSFVTYLDSTAAKHLQVHLTTHE